MITEPLKQKAPLVVLAIVLALSALSRARDIRWGIEGHPRFSHSQHSDEERKIRYTLEMQPTFEGLRPDPWLVVKGTLLPTIGRLLYALVEHTPLERAFAIAFGAPLASVEGRYLFFRSICAAASLALVLLVFLLARLLSGSAWAGAFAAALLATAFGGAFAAVIFKSDMLLAVLVGGVAVTTVWYMGQPTAARAIAMGALLGLAGATKHSGVFAAAMPALACGFASGPGWRARLGHLSLAAASAVTLLVLSAPYYVLDFPVLLEALQKVARYESERSYHFEGFGFQPLAVVTHLLVPGLGPILTGLSLVGLGWALQRAVRHRERAYTPLLGFVAVYFTVLSVSSWLVVRYTLPLYPVLSAFGGIVTWRAASALARRRTAVSRLGISVLLALAIGQVLYFLAFDRMLSEPTPPAQAATWLKGRLPEDASVLEIRRRRPAVYGFAARAPEALTASRVETLVADGQRLSVMPVDYVIVTEEAFRHFFRLRDSRYARQRLFYAELFDLQRFEPVARFETPARVLGIEVPKPFLPEDLVLVSPVTYVFRRVGGRGTPSP